MVGVVLPRARGKGAGISRAMWSALGATALLGACGGGGGADAGSGAGSLNTSITQAEVQTGDYLVYTTTNTPTVPAGQQPNTLSQVRSYVSIASDGTSQQQNTYSINSPITLYTLDVNDALVGTSSASGAVSNVCTYAPALQSAPPYPRTIGQSWQQTSQRTCGATIATVTQTGKVLARESVTVPAGTFDSYKAERTSSSQSSTGTTAQTLTCWYSAQRGVVLQCDYTSTNTPAGSTTPSNVITTSMRLTGWGGPGRPVVGAVLPRFAGYWRVQYLGGTSGNCGQLLVSASGIITGNCTASSGATFSVAGTVNDSGTIDITLASGGKLTGTLNTPYSGQGNWVDGGLTGTWTASHN